jgi:hypothetical protein
MRASINFVDPSPQLEHPRTVDRCNYPLLVIIGFLVVLAEISLLKKLQSNNLPGASGLASLYSG